MDSQQNVTEYTIRQFASSVFLHHAANKVKPSFSVNPFAFSALMLLVRRQENWVVGFRSG